MVHSGPAACKLLFPRLLWKQWGWIKTTIWNYFPHCKGSSAPLLRVLQGLHLASYSSRSDSLPCQSRAEVLGGTLGLVPLPPSPHNHHHHQLQKWTAATYFWQVALISDSTYSALIPNVLIRLMGTFKLKFPMVESAKWTWENSI